MIDGLAERCGGVQILNCVCYKSSTPRMFNDSHAQISTGISVSLLSKCRPMSKFPAATRNEQQQDQFRILVFDAEGLQDYRDSPVRAAAELGALRYRIFILRF